MRLIDADKLIEDLKGSMFYTDAIPFVEEAPTAYDVDAVVKQFDSEHRDYYYDEAIEIVRKGGEKDAGHTIL